MIYTFGPFTLDTELYELRREGTALPAEPKVLEVLALLIAERRRIVAKEELVREGEAQLAGGEQERWLERLDAEHGNLLAALSWARSGGEVEVGLATAAALARYWSARGTYREGRKEVETLLGLAGTAGVSTTVAADARVALGMLCLLLCDYPAAADALDRALALLRPLGDRQRLAHTLNHLGWVMAQGTEVERAAEICREALALHREAGNPRGIAVALNNLGWLAFYRGEAEEAERLFGESLAERRAAEDDRGVAFALGNLAVLRLHLTDRWEELDCWLDEAQERVERLGDRPLTGWILCARGALEARRGATDRALTLLSESGTLGLDYGNPDGRAWCRLFQGEVRAQRGEAEAAQACLEEARELWQRLGVPWGVVQASRRLADLARSGGDDPAARRLYQQALTLSESVRNQACAEGCRRALAELSS